MMPDSDALIAVMITLKSVVNCFMRLNVTIKDSGTPVDSRQVFNQHEISYSAQPTEDTSGQM